MIFNLGTTVPLTWTNGTTLGPATLVVTDPSGNKTTISGVTDNGTGTYASSYTPAVYGLFDVLWTATLNGVSGSYQDVFEVRPQSPTALISLQDAKEHLRKRANDTADDLKIQSFVEASSRLVLDITGPLLVETHTQWFDGGVPTVRCDYGPLIQVAAAAEFYGISKFVLTEQPLGAQTNAFAFTVDYLTGQITRRTYGGARAMFAIGDKNVVITYTVGRTYVPENVQLATKELVRHLYRGTQVPGRPNRNGDAYEDGFGEVPIGFAVPNFVVELLQPDRRPPGIA